MSKWEKQLMDLLGDESFQAWLSGRATEAESCRWQAWLKEDVRHRRLYQAALEIWRRTRFTPEPPQDATAAWQQLQDRLGFSDAASPLSVSPTPELLPLRERGRKFRSRSSVSWLMGATVAIAAVLVVLALIWPGIGFLRETPGPLETLRTAYGEQLQIKLPDQTRIVLNANSVLEYPAKWTAKTPRRIRLSGEAYFEVAKGVYPEQSEFMVETSDGCITVLGTRFVVHARGVGTRVTLSEGKVKVAVRSSRKDAGPEVQAYLRPGEQVFFRRNDAVLTPTDDGYRQLVWWEEEFVLKQTPLEDFVNHLQETYGVSIYVADSRMLKRRLSGSIESTSLEVVLDALGKLLQVPVHRRGTLIVLG